MRFFAFLLFITIFSTVFSYDVMAQAKSRKKKCDTCNDNVAAKPGQFKKGEFHIYWGYNRAWYGKSDIHFTGNGVDFTVDKVKAKDRPSPFDFKTYFGAITIPQFVASGAYFFKDNWAVTFGTDHMKYVMVTDQTVNITGTIEANVNTGAYAGTYNNQPIKLTTDFLRFEHTNGLNYVNAGIEYYHVLWDAKKGPFKFVAVPGFSVGVMYPRSDVDLFNVEGSNVFHVAGWGTALHAGLRFNVLKNVFILFNNKVGFTHLPDILCELNKYDATQHFVLYQTALSLGYNFRF